jgi:hypothetical protein
MDQGLFANPRFLIIPWIWQGLPRYFDEFWKKKIEVKNQPKIGTYRTKTSELQRGSYGQVRSRAD